MRREDLRERVAMTIYSWSIVFSSFKIDQSWSHLAPHVRKAYRKRAEQIIAIVEEARRG